MTTGPDQAVTPLVVAVVGGSGSGKSTAVEALIDVLGATQCVAVSFDAYYRDNSHLEPHERARVNFDDPASLDVELFAQHLAALRRGTGIDVPVYDFATHTRTAEVVPVASRPIVLVDGILTLAVDEVRDQVDRSVFLDVPQAVRLERRLARDVAERGRTPESVRMQFAATVAPMHEQFVDPSRAHADVVIEHPFTVDEVVRAALELVSRPATTCRSSRRQ